MLRIKVNNYLISVVLGSILGWSVVYLHMLTSLIMLDNMEFISDTVSEKGFSALLIYVAGPTTTAFGGMITGWFIGMLINSRPIVNGVISSVTAIIINLIAVVLSGAPIKLYMLAEYSFLVIALLLMLKWIYTRKRKTGP